MDYPIDHVDFKGRGLAVRPAGLFRSARVVLDRVEFAGKKGKFTVTDFQGRTHEITLKINGIDPVPKVVMDGVPIILARSLTWYEYAWMGIPVFLVFAGGLLGAMFGLVATYMSARIFRSDRGAVVKYVLTGIISFGAIGGFIVGAVALQLLVEGYADISSKEILEEIAQSTNESLPMQVDDQTELVNVEGLEGILVYHYRVTEIPAEPVTKEFLLEDLRPVATINACDDSDVRETLLDNGVTLRYTYADSQDVEIAQFDIAVGDCQ